MPRTHLSVYIHFVWSTLNREPIITDAIERRIHRYIEGICMKHQCQVFAIGGTSNHIHLLVNITSTISLSSLMHNIKGSSSRFVTTELKPDCAFEWQEGYGAFSVSPADKIRVQDYIYHQKEHHAAGTVWNSVEDVEPE